MKFAATGSDSEHELSKYLQITQQRIRNLKARASVKYLTVKPDEAIKIFIDQVSHAKIEGNFLDIPVSDIAVRNEIEAILESKSLLLHIQRNPKIFRVRVDDFLELAIQLEVMNGKKDESKVEESIIKELRKKAKEDRELMDKLSADKLRPSDWTKDTIKAAMLKGGLSFGIDMLASLVPGGTLFTGHAKKLLQSIGDKV